MELVEVACEKAGVAVSASRHTASSPMEIFVAAKRRFIIPFQRPMPPKTPLSRVAGAARVELLDSWLSKRKAPSHVEDTPDATDLQGSLRGPAELSLQRASRFP